MYIQSRWCVQPFSTCFFLWCSRKIDLGSFRRIKMLVPPPTIKYGASIFNPELPTFKWVSKRFQLDKILDRLFSIMTWSEYATSMDSTIISLGIFMVQWVIYIIAWQFRWAILENIFIMGLQSVDCYFIAH